MKKLKLWSFLMLAVMMMPLVASCGGNDDSDDNIPSNSMVSYLTSREFSIKDFTVLFDKNGSIYMYGGGARPTSGSLSGQIYQAYGAWSLSGNKMTVDFFFDDFNDGLSYTPYNLVPQQIDLIDRVTYYEFCKSGTKETIYLNPGNTRTCYSTAEKYDGGVIGKWFVNATMTNSDGSKHNVTLYISLNSDGKANFKIDNEYDETTNYTTNKGIIKFESFLDYKPHDFFYRVNWNSLSLIETSSGNLFMKLTK